MSSAATMKAWPKLTSSMVTYREMGIKVLKRRKKTKLVEYVRRRTKNGGERVKTKKGRKERKEREFSVLWWRKGQGQTMRATKEEEKSISPLTSIAPKWAG